MGIANPVVPPHFSYGGPNGSNLMDYGDSTQDLDLHQALLMRSSAIFGEYLQTQP